MDMRDMLKIFEAIKKLYNRIYDKVCKDGRGRINRIEIFEDDAVFHCCRTDHNPIDGMYVNKNIQYKICQDYDIQKIESINEMDISVKEEK